MRTSSTLLNSCLCCGGSNLYRYLELPDQHPINNLARRPNEKRELFPLKVNFCRDCSHSQQSVSVDPEYLFSNYLYVSGTSKTLDEDFEDLAQLIFQKTWGNVKNAKLSVLDVAGNDGSFLVKFKKYGCKTCCVDPAENLFEACQAREIDLAICDFFPTNCLGELKFDVITALNVVAHVPDPLSFLKEFAKRLNPNGKAFIQVSQRYMQKNCEFDTVYHEHISFFTDKSMATLAKRAGLDLIQVIERPIHGTSTLFILGRQEDGWRSELPPFEDYYQDLNLYKNFQSEYQKRHNACRDFINLEKAFGRRIVGYGAAAKGLNLINCFGLEPEYVVDDNPLKQGTYLPNSSIQIVSSKKLAEEQWKDDNLCVVVFAWNFFEEITAKIKEILPNATTVAFFS